LVALLSLADFGGSIAFLLSPFTSDYTVCYAQAVLTSYFSVASVLCTVSIAYVLYQGVVMQNKGIEKLLWPLVAFSYGVPVVTTALPLTTGSFGEDIGLCWMKTNVEGTIWKFLQFYLILWYAIGFNIYCYVQVYKTVHTLLEHVR
jgi:hypothetical protein